MTGGTVIGGTNGINLATGSATITDGKVSGTQNGVNIADAGILQLGDNTAPVSIIVPEINSTATGAYYGVNKGNSGTFNFYDGKVTSSKGAGYSLSADPDDVPSGYAVARTVSGGTETAVLKTVYTIEYTLDGGTQSTSCQSGSETVNQAV